jgi:hypothetical protein
MLVLLARQASSQARDNETAPRARSSLTPGAGGGRYPRVRLVDFDDVHVGAWGLPYNVDNCREQRAGRPRSLAHVFRNSASRLNGR